MFHEESGDVSAFTYGSLSISQMTLDQVRNLKFKPSALHGPEHRVHGSHIPTLEDVLLALRDRTSMRVTVELKGAQVEIPALDVVRRTGMLARVNMSSFVHDRVIKAKQEEPSLSIALLFNHNSSPTPAHFATICQSAGASQADIRYDTFQQ